MYISVDALASHIVLFIEIYILGNINKNVNHAWNCKQNFIYLICNFLIYNKPYKKVILQWDWLSVPRLTITDRSWYLALLILIELKREVLNSMV